jgi:SAM-dependent methyltransferase
MTSAPPAADPGAFVQDRPNNLRNAVPWHPYAQLIRELPAAIETLVSDLHLGPGSRVLDYGCAELPYRHLFPDDVEVVGADLPGNPHASVLIRPDGTLPVEDGSFDAILSTQVLEHARDPRLYVAECFRVLRPGGRLLLTTHGVFVYHPDPVDYWRWTCAGLRCEVELAGFEVARFRGIVGLLATGLQLVHDGLYTRFPRWLRPLMTYCLQALMTAAERWDTTDRELNAMVYGLVALKPAD